jgi:hypothetical protein
MNRMKRVALNVVVMVGMTLAMSSLGLAQQETIPDQFLGADEISATQPVAQQKEKGKAQSANSHRQSKTSKQQVAKQKASTQQTVVIARK